MAEYVKVARPYEIFIIAIVYSYPMFTPAGNINFPIKPSLLGNGQH